MTADALSMGAPPGRQGQKRYGGGGRRPAPSLACQMSHLAVIFAREIPVQTRCPDQYLRERRRVDRWLSGKGLSSGEVKKILGCHRTSLVVIVIRRF